MWTSKQFARFLKRSRIAPLAVLLLLCSADHARGQEAAKGQRIAKPARSWVVTKQPIHLVNGGPVAFRVKPPVALQSLSGEWRKHDIDFTFDPRTKAWWAIAGVSLNTRPGSYPLVLKGTTKGTQEVSFERRFAITKGKYRSKGR